MKTGMHAGIMLAPLLAAMLLAGAAQANETGSAGSGDELALTGEGEDGLVPLDSEAMAEATGGFAVQVSDTDQQTTFADNPVTVDNGGQINTGGILSLNANSGGITTTMLNTGNNVSFQNSTTLNIYLDGVQ